VGEVYEVGTTLANYLLAIGAAEPVSEDTVVRPASQADGARLDSVLDEE
jgi:hypothetical protein